MVNVWVDDERFDINRHMFEMAVEPPGGDARDVAVEGIALGALRRPASVLPQRLAS
jgi:hypothetical protein